MISRNLQIPGGMQDTLPSECRRKRKLKRDMLELFRLGGYMEIETPILEYYDALDDDVYGYRPTDVWKTFDSSGRILALRPDTTIPAARLAAGRLAEEPLPLRLCYIQSANRFRSESLSMLCEETQAGAELMGESSPEADAEVIALAVQALRQSGLKDFQVELGQAMFFDGFMQEAGLNPEETARIRELTEQKNPLAIQMTLKKLAVSEEVTKRLMKLPTLYGDISVLDEAEKLTEHPMCRRAIENLRRILAILEDYGCADAMTVDLGMVQHASYYSGTIFRGMTASLGQPLLSGGRYDGMVSGFGRELPAVGFAVSLKLLLMALERQGEAFEKPVPDILVAFKPGCLKEAINYAREQRESGRSATLLYNTTQEEMNEKLQRGEGKSAIYIC